jgi:hypothetical protein
MKWLPSTYVRSQIFAELELTCECSSSGPERIGVVFVVIVVVRTVHFGMKFYNDHRKARVFNVFIYLLVPYMFRAFFKPIFRSKCTNSAVVEVLGYGISARGR